MSQRTRVEEEIEAMGIDLKEQDSSWLSEIVGRWGRLSAMDGGLDEITQTYICDVLRLARECGKLEEKIRTQRQILRGSIRKVRSLQGQLRVTRASLAERNRIIAEVTVHV